MIGNALAVIEGFVAVAVRENASAGYRATVFGPPGFSLASSQVKAYKYGYRQISSLCLGRLP